ncbi:MAG: hypothetical protein R3F19_20645 [Verrucomicrobiales bacterium]
MRTLVATDLDKSQQLFDQLPTAAAPAAAPRILIELGKQGADSALAWFNQQSPERLGSRSYAQMAWLQFYNDSLAASQWVASLPSGRRARLGCR